MLLRSKHILLHSRGILEDGAVFISGDRIGAVGPFSDIHSQHPGPVEDLGEVTIIPGLINSHTHLEYTRMAGRLLENRSFTEWVPKILEAKRKMEFQDYVSSWAAGEKMSLRSGITTTIDSISFPALLREVWNQGGSRLIFCLEITGLLARRDPVELVRDTIALLKTLPPQPHRSFGLAPHALYSTHPLTMQNAASEANTNGWPLSVHVAESEAEQQMYADASGPLYDFIRKIRHIPEAGGISPVQLLEKWGALNPNMLAIHANYLREGDAHLLARNSCSVVHCPQSHAFFQHGSFPLKELRNEKVNVCVGTDSLASQTAAELNLFAELAAFRKTFPEVSPQDVFDTVTINPAKAVHRQNDLGRLIQGAFADLAVLQVNLPPSSLLEAITASQPTVLKTMVAGKWVE